MEGWLGGFDARSKVRFDMICGDDKARGGRRGVLGGSTLSNASSPEPAISANQCLSWMLLARPLKKPLRHTSTGWVGDDLSERFLNFLRIRSDCNWLSSFSDSEVAVAKILCSTALEPEKDCTVASTSCDESLLVCHHWATVLIDFCAPRVSNCSFIFEMQFEDKVSRIIIGVANNE